MLLLAIAGGAVAYFARRKLHRGDIDNETTAKKKVDVNVKEKTEALDDSRDTETDENLPGHS